MRFTHTSGRTALGAAATLALVGSVMVGCAPSESGTPASAASSVSSAAEANQKTSLVATTQVWADVAAAVTGEHVDAIISGTSIDPHHFEPSATELARVSEAEHVVATGGAYDATLYTVADQDKVIHAIPLLDAAEAHSHDHGHEGHGHRAEEAEDPFNFDAIEHAFFSPKLVAQVAEEIQAKVGGDAGSVVEQMRDIEQRLAGIAHTHMAMTEPIAAGLVYGTELHDATPEGYLRSALNHAEPSAQDVAAFVQLIESGDLDFLVVNPQSTNAATQRLADAAKASDVPIVEITETPPAGTNFLDYLAQIVDQIEELAAHAKEHADAHGDGAAHGSDGGHMPSGHSH
ncbi:zinc ABC transporter substrate-binding protein [Corynebacterium aquatimens]|uniref:metal ABC transporter solute-binding protein, Zn/Mn family n=1 Tax=Corynebacterium aquatimens TaxID=1190508 RepID=UPI002540F32E|nr:zinc ABC transporter substrate-binding protein [Corynebacterium aquatimens]QYH19262.1 zinc ABC transporter substrate-binding protein [Corynebacterium aquatimens]